VAEYSVGDYRGWGFEVMVLRFSGLHVSRSGGLEALRDGAQICTMEFSYLMPRHVLFHT